MAVSKKFDGAQRAAILLMTMGDTFAKDVLKALGSHEIELIGKCMGGLEDTTIPVTAVKDIMNKFRQECLEVSGISGKQGMEFIQRSIKDALGD